MVEHPVEEPLREDVRERVDHQRSPLFVSAAIDSLR
jgi:hypothetical protein